MAVAVVRSSLARHEDLRPSTPCFRKEEVAFYRSLDDSYFDLPWAEDGVAAIIRITGGHFRLLNRRLTQMERIFGINSLRQVTKGVVEAARESLVIAQS